ncbi:MAG: POTRA domain-containing protein, partial [Planctomycetota bacterium]
MSSVLTVLWRVIARCLLAGVFGLLVPDALAQDDELRDRPIGVIRVEGLDRVAEGTVATELRSAIGDPYDPEVVRADVRRINRLGEFKSVEARAALRPDGTVELVYVIEEQAIITAVQVVGNKLVSDQELLGAVRQFPGLARDDYLIENGRKAMEDIYQQRGYYLATVTINEEELDRSGLLLFQVIEGPRVRVKAVDFDGNEAFQDKQLAAEIKSKPSIPLIRKGVLDQDVMAEDIGALDRFYKARGYLDVRVDRQIVLSPDNREAKIVFLVEEGEQFVLRTVTATSIFGDQLEVFAPEQI